MMIELWVVIVLAAALFSSSKSIIQKHLTEDLDSIQVGQLTSVLGLVFMFPVGLYGLLEGNNSFGTLAVGGLMFSGVGNIVASYLFIEAVSISDISKISPIRRLTPMTVALFEPIFLGIAYSTEILVGAFLTLVGGLLVISDNGIGKMPEPDKGLMLALFLPLLGAFMTIAERYATQRISPFLFTFLIYAVMAVGFSAVCRYRRSTVDRRLFKKPVILGVGVATSLTSVTTFYALSIVSASHFTIVKQSSILFSVIIGGKLFKEERLCIKALGSLLMIAGIILSIQKL